MGWNRILAGDELHEILILKTATIGGEMLKNKLFLRLYFLIGVFSTLGFFPSGSHATEAPPDMNKYVLEAVQYLSKHYSNGGYDITLALTHDLPYNQEIIKAKRPPRSQCVAGMLEVIIHAMEFYARDNPTNREVTYAFLPVRSWSRLRPTDIKSHLWVDPRLNSWGTGDALHAFGIGQRLKFSELKAGDFVNLNRPRISGHRKKPSGHAVVFLAYLDEKGGELTEYSSSLVAGMKYFSHQETTNGFGYKHGFFLKKDKWFCPKVSGASVDCGVMITKDQKYLNSGRLYAPTEWDSQIRDSYLAKLTKTLYEKTKTKGPAYIGIDSDLTQEQFEIELERTADVMELNPLFLNGANE